MKKKTLAALVLSALLSILVSLSSSLAHASFGELQILYTSQLDFDRMVPTTIAACERADVPTGSQLRKAYADFQREHLPYQSEVRDYLARKLGTVPEFTPMLGQARSNMKRFVDEYFPQDPAPRDKGFCAQHLLASLKGERVMLRFKDYAQEIRQTGDMKVFRRR